MAVLDPNPESRPTLDAILRHRWFMEGEFPATIPLIALDSQPSFRSLGRTESRRNFQLVCQRAKIGGNLPMLAESSRPRTALGPSIMQQERDFKNAVQPDSPISALLQCVVLTPSKSLADSAALPDNRLYKLQPRSRRARYCESSQLLELTLLSVPLDAASHQLGPPHDEWRYSTRTRRRKRNSWTLKRREGMMPEYEYASWQTKRPELFRKCWRKSNSA